MKVIKEIFRTLIASVIIVIITVVVQLTVRLITAQLSTGWLLVTLIIVLLGAGCFFQKIFSKA